VAKCNVHQKLKEYRGLTALGIHIYLSSHLPCKLQKTATPMQDHCNTNARPLQHHCNTTLPPLGCAAAFGRLEVCVELVLAGADVFVLNDEGKTPLQVIHET
jgi:ankyrin repeat protein